MKALGVATFLASSLVPSLALATTYEVGSGKAYATIQDTLPLLQPGDVVEVQGDQSYPGDIWLQNSGAANAPITIRGIRVNGKRPVISGIGSEQWHDMIVLFYANHLVFEGFEIVGDGDPDHGGLVHKGDDITIRDVVVHGVGTHGLLGTDSESGSLTLESSEFYGNGSGLYDHQIYMATDESMYPGSVFRMQACYVHDAAGGNNVKSRAERNEIYANWIEGAVYHELDLIGPDGADPSLAREDSDVVGNVLIKHSEWHIARIGGDGTGNTSGRYRFVNNTMVLAGASDTVISLQETVESLELYNNVVVQLGGNGAVLLNYNEPSGPAAQVSGSNNWIQAGIAEIPSELTGTISGSDPGFTNLAVFDLRLLETSPLVDAGTANPISNSPAFPSPLLLPTLVPPARAQGTEQARPDDGKPDVGAFEYGVGAIPGPGGGGGSGGGNCADANDCAEGDGVVDGCGCQTNPDPASALGWFGLALAGMLAKRRARRPRPN